MKPLRLHIADAIFDYLYKHHLGDFAAESLDRHHLDWIDTGDTDLLNLADAIIHDTGLTP